MRDSHQWPDSLWESTATTANPSPALKEDISADLLIVGGGYTGLSTALHAKHLFSKVVLIDQVQPGWGCSGRNGGQINPQWKSSIDHLKSEYSGRSFENFVSLLATSAQNVFSLIDEHSIDCCAMRSGALIPAKGKKSYQYLNDWSNYWQAYGANVELLDQSDTAAVIGTSAYDSCLLMKEGGSLQPLSFARGLLRACRNLSVEIYGDTEALRVTASGNEWLVSTQHGNILCKCLVIATNGYTGRLWPGLKQNIYPIGSMISATAPLSEGLAHTVLPGKQSVAEYAGLPFYYRLDERNRFVMGGRGTRSGGVGSLDTSHLHRITAKLFPQLRKLRWEFNWAGYVGVTVHQKPMLLRLGPNAYAGLGYNGRGITMATTMGHQLSQALAGKDTLLPIDAPGKSNLYPFYRLGVAGRILYGEWIDRRSGLR
ncbi:MAG: FAD-binding oxidoreductase [Acidiferrobacterales bacterium]|nr:FAD-binding oxidoreductase [Acidiferrobacterales bacterium]